MTLSALSTSSSPATANELHDGQGVYEGDPMYIALFLSELAGGGAQRRMLLLADAFAARGHRVDLVAARSDGPFRARVPPSVQLVGLDNRWARLPGIRSRRGLWVAASTGRLAQYLRRARPDVVLAISNPANLAALWARRMARVAIPVVASVNVHLGAATGPRQRAWGPLLRALICRYYRDAEAVIANSRSVTEDLSRTARVPRERIATIYNPVAVERVAEEARSEIAHSWFAEGQSPVVLGVGKLKRQKDFPTLLRAFAQVRAKRPIRLVILGEGEERGDLERLARRLGIAGDVQLPGFVENPFPWMTHASVFVLSSVWEGFSNALCEALACGCPVISTDCPGGSSEILGNGAYGSLVPVGDDAALAAAIGGMLDSPPDREWLRARAAEFSVDRAAGRYLEILRSVRWSEGRMPESPGMSAVYSGP